MSPQRRRKRKQLRIFPVMVLFCLIAATFFYGKPLVTHLFSGEFSFSLPSLIHIKNGDDTITTAKPSFSNKSNPSINLNNLYSPYAILIDLEKHTILAEKDSSKQIYPASLTKMMTAIIAIEETDNLKDTILLTEEMFTPLYINHASIAGFSPNEKVRKDDLLYGVLLPSGAECCLALATDISSSEKDFVELMNKKAKKIGMKNTHFTNTIGLQDSGHYSTAEDMAVLLSYALENKTFRKVFTSKSYTTHATTEHPDGIKLTSTTFAYLEGITIPGGDIIGGKTGYTTEAGQCLASLATINGKDYILITAGAPGDPQTENLHIQDAITVYSQIGAPQS